MSHNWNYFRPDEVEGLQTEVVAKLDAARHKAGVPFIITSAKRTAEQNEVVGGVKDSAHLKGLAVDLAVTDSNSLFEMVASLITVGFPRIVIGIGLNALDGKVLYHNLHCDLDFSLPNPILAVKRY